MELCASLARTFTLAKATNDWSCSFECQIYFDSGATWHVECKKLQVVRHWQTHQTSGSFFLAQAWDTAPTIRCVFTLLGWRAWSSGFNPWINKLQLDEWQMCNMLYDVVCSCFSSPKGQYNPESLCICLWMSMCFGSFNTKDFASVLRKYKWSRFQHLLHLL